ncbi:putative repeat protein (TIGR01451 family) [Flavobacteriaceae bacterium MAR_2010_72]|nr:putative repeat protein (TIGR01451 family) [Flavobacteriaceae bacterium MAR_2010_72]
MNKSLLSFFLATLLFSSTYSLKAKELIPNKTNNSSSINTAYGLSLMNPDNAPCNLKEPLVNGVNFDLLTAAVTDDVPIFPEPVLPDVQTCFGSMSGEGNLVDADLNNFASVSITGIGCNGEFQVVDSNHVYPTGMFAGFKVSSDGLLQASTGLNVTIRTYLGNVLQETYAAVTDDGVSGLDASSIDADGNAILGFITSSSFDEIRIEYQNTAGALFEAEVYYPVVQQFCEATLLCNAPTSFTNAEFPVIINYSNTGPDSVTCALCTVTNAENVITSSDSDYASFELTAGALAEASIAVEDVLTTYPANNFAGFEIENVPVLAGSLNTSIKITTYLDGVQQEDKTGTFALAGTSTAGVSDRRIVGFITTVPFDQIQLTLINTAAVDLGETRVYRAVVEKFCPVEIPCNETVYLNNGDPGFPIIIDEFKTGLTGLGCALCAVTNSSNVISPSTTDFAKIEIFAGASISGAISVVDAVSTFPEGSVAGFAIEDVSTLPLDLSLLSDSITICTFLDGVQQECTTGTDLLDLTAVPGDIFGTAAGRYNIGFETILPYDEITITVESLVGLDVDLKVFGAFVDTRTATGEFGVLCNPLPAWTVTKTADVANYDAVDDIISYVILVENTGNVSINTVSVSDPNADAAPVRGGDNIGNDDAVLEPGEIWTYAAAHTITQADLDAGNFANTATATGTPAGGTLPDAEGTEDVPAVQSPSWTVTKTADVANYDAVDDIISYVILVENTGNVSINTVSVSDPNADAAPVRGGDNIGNDDAVLEPGEIWTYAAAHTITQADLDAGNFANTATATGTPAGGTLPDAEGTEDVPAVQSPSWTVTKTADVANYDAVDDIISYVILVENTGNVSINTVSVSDPNADAAPVRGGDNIGNDDAVLEPGEVWTYAAAHTITQADLDAGNFANTATATGTPAGGTLPDAEGTEDVPAVQSPSWTVTKTADVANYDAVDDIISYVILVENTGNVSINTVSVSDPNADAAPVRGGDNIGNDDAVLEPGEIWTYAAAHTITQADLDAGNFANTATATGTPAGGTLPDAEGTEDVPAVQSPSWTVTKTADVANYDAVDDIISYVILVENTGNVSINTVSVSDPNADAAPVRGGDNIGNDDAVLEPGEIWTYAAAHTITQADLDAGNFANTATATGTPAGGTLPDAEGTEDVPAVQSPSWTVTKTADVANYDAVDDIISYVILVENTGNVSINTVSVSDPNADAAPVRGGDNIGNDDAVLEPGEIWTYAAAHTITQADLDAGNFANTATATGTPAGGTLPDAEGTEDVPAVQSPSWTVTKTADVANYDAVDDIISYVILVENTGNVSINTVSVSDPNADAAPVRGGDNIGNDDAVLEPGEIWTYAAAHTITQADLDAGNFANTATATGTPAGGTLPDAEGTEDVPAVQSPSWTVTKTADVANYDAVDDIISYVILVENTGNVSINTVSVSDPNADAAPVRGGDNIGNDDAVLEPGEVWTYAAAHTITQADLDAGNFANTATATGTPAGGTLPDAEGTEDVPAVQSPSWTVTKTADVANYDAVDDIISYVILVENTGNVSINTVSVSDPNADAAPVRGGDNIGNDDAVLEPGEIWTYAAAHTITQADLDAGNFANTATATGTPAGGTLPDAEGTEDVPAVQSPSWTVTKTADVANYDAVDDIISYVILVENTGNVSINTVSVSDPNADAAPVRGGDNIGNDDAVLEPGEIWTYAAAHTITQADLDAGNFANTATATGTPAGGTLPDAEGTEDVPAVQSPSWTVTKTADVANYDAVDDIISYVILVENTGNVSINTVSVSDPNADAAPVRGGDNIGNDDAVLEPGEVWTYAAAHTITQADLDAGNFANTATATGTPAGGTLPDAEGTEDVPAVQSPSWTVTKTADVANYDAVDDIISYVILVENTGNVSINTVSVSDPNADAAPVRGGDNIGNDDAVLEPGEVWTYAAAHTITQADLDAGNFANTATATGTPAGGTLPDAEGTEDVPAVQSPSWTVTKTADVANYDAVDDIISYVILVENTGNVSINTVSVSDPNADAAPVRGGDNIGNDDAVLEPGEVWTYAAAHTITQADLDAGNFANTATATGTPAGGTLPDAEGTEDVPAVQLPELTTTKSATETTYVAVDDEINYTITVKNTGNVTIDNVAITDANADAGSISYVSGDDGDNILQVGETWTYSAVHTVTQADLDGGLVDNIANAAGEDTNNNIVEDDSDKVTVNATQNNSITTIKSTSETAYAAVGTVLDYTITLENDGNTTVYDPTMVDATADADPIRGTDQVGNDDDVLNVGEIWTYTAQHTVTQLDIDRGFYTNTAEGDALADNDGDGLGDAAVESDESETVNATQNNSITTIKSTSETAYAAVGTVLDYTITLENDGNTTVYDPTMVDATADADPIRGTDQVGNDDDVLNVGEIWTYTAQHTVTQLDIDRGFYTNTAEGDALADNDGDGLGDAAVESDESETVNATQNNSITTIKSTSETAYAAVGTVLDYTITLENDGNTTVYDPTMVDATADADPIRGTDQVGNDDDVLNVGEIWTYTAQHTVTQLDIDRGFYTNTAEGDALADNDGDGLGDAAVESDESETVNATQNNSITTIKSTSETAYAAVGTVLDYTITLENDGNTTVYDPTMVDATADADPIRGTDQVGNDDDVLNVGEIWTYTAQHTVTQLDIDRGFYTNTAEGDALADNDGDGLGDAAVESDESETVNATQNNSITTIKSTSETAYAAVGTVLDYTITLENDGNTTVYTPTMVDTTADADPIRGTDQVGNDDDVLNVGEIWTYTAQHTVTQLDIDRGFYTNTAEGDALADNDGDGLGDAAVESDESETVNATQNNSITTIKSTSETAYAAVGTVLDYTITLENDGNTTVYDPTMVDATADADPIRGTDQVGNDDDVLNVGEIWTYTAQHTVTQLDIDRGFYTNTAEGDALADNDGDGLGDAAVESDESETVNATQNNSITTIKSTSETAYAAVGTVLDYTITLENDGNTTVYDPTMVDATADADPIRGTDQVGNDDDVLNVGEIWTYTAQHTVTQLDIDRGFYTNTAEGDALADNDGDGLGDAAVESDESETVNATQNNSITTIKSTSETAYAAVGTVLDYTITLENDGNTTVYDPTMVDATADADPIRGTDQVGNDDDVLNVGEIWTYTAQHTVTQLDIDRGFYTNTAEGDALADNDGDGLGDAAVESDESETVNATQNNSITTIKSTSETAYAAVGTVLDYTITLENDGNTTVYDPTMVDATADADPIRGTDQVGNDDDVLNVGEIWTYTAQHTVTQLDIDRGFYTNTAEGDALADNDGDGLGDAAVESDESETVNATQNNSITTIKSTSETAYAAVGTVLDYTITLENDGNTTVYDPTMVDATADADPIRGTDQVGNDDDVLNVGEIWTYTAQHTVTQLDIDRGFYTNTAEGDALADNDGDGVGDAAVESDESETVDAIQTNAVVVSKTSTEDRYGYGDIIHYTITLANTGNTTVYDPVVSDPDATTGPTYASGDTDNDGVLDVGETWTYNATHTITQNDSDSDSFTNTATGSGSADNDGDGLGDAPVSDTDDDTVTAIPNQTGFARSTTDATCFLDDGFERWGWTNYFATEGSYTLPLYIGAALCDLDKGKLIGTVLVNYTGGEVTITYNVDTYYGIRQIHVYVGCEPYPTKKRSTTVAPGQYPYKISTLDHVSSYTVGPLDVSSLDNGVYVIAHALISEHLCEDCYEAVDDGGSYSPRKNSVSCRSGKNTSKESSQSNFKAYPVPFRDELTIEYSFEYDTDVTIEVFDIKGALVKTKKKHNYRSGSNEKLKLDFSRHDNQLYFVKIGTNREQFVKKVIRNGK